MICARSYMLSPALQDMYNVYIYIYILIVDNSIAVAGRCQWHADEHTVDCTSIEIKGGLDKFSSKRTFTDLGNSCADRSSYVLQAKPARRSRARNFLITEEESAQRRMTRSVRARTWILRQWAASIHCVRRKEDVKDVETTKKMFGFLCKRPCRAGKAHIDVLGTEQRAKQQQARSGRAAVLRTDKHVVTQKKLFVLTAESCRAGDEPLCGDISKSNPSNYTSRSRSNSGIRSR